MGIIKNVKNFIEYTKMQPAERLVKEAEQKDDTERAVIEAAKAIDSPELLQEFLEEIIANKKLPNSLVEDMTKIIITEAKEPEMKEASINVVAENLDDTATQNIVELVKNDEELPRESGLPLIAGMNDPKIQMTQIERYLKDFYNSDISNIKETDIVEELKRVKETSLEDVSDEANKIINKIIAKKIACNYASMGGTKTYTLGLYESLEKMFENRMQDLVQEEYDIIKSKKKNIREYHKSDLKGTLLENIAKEVAKNFEECGEYIIPQSKEMAKLSKEEIQKFIKDIEYYRGKNITRRSALSIKAQIKGIIGINNLDTLFEKIQDLPTGRRNELIPIFNKMIEEPKTLEIIKEVLKTDIPSMLKNESTEDIRKTVNAINEVLNKKNKEKQNKTINDQTE